MEVPVLTPVFGRPVPGRPVLSPDVDVILSERLVPFPDVEVVLSGRVERLVGAVEDEVEKLREAITDATGLRIYW